MNRPLILSLLSLLAFFPMVKAADFSASEGAWTLEMPETTKTLTIKYNGKSVFNSAYASVTYNYVGESTDRTITSLNATDMPIIEVSGVTDEFGAGKAYSLRYTDKTGATMCQRFFFYPELPHMIVQVDITGADGREVQSRSLTALAIGASSIPLTGASNRTVWVPFCNDGHVRYEVRTLTNSAEVSSHEVGYVFDGESRLGLIAGSVDHDKWKSVVITAGTGGYKLEKFTCLSGFTNYYTQDILPHGKVKGTTVASSRFFVGYYDDWRQGLNDYADANNKVAPRPEWTKGNPMGWSSWGVMQNYINYEGVVETARFIKNELFDLGFHDNNGQTTISLDSFAGTNISAGNLYKLGTKVLGEGTYKDGFTTQEGTNQILGEYGGHLVAWPWALDSKIPGTGLNGSPDYTYREAALKINGQPYMLPNGGNAMDPTHPAVKANVEYALRQYAANGTKYIKIDFIDNGAVEGDSWYDPNVTTGIQAYNYGMKLLYDEALKYDMYIVLAMSPTFPYQYAHGRRTCCDRFSEIGETEYVMNAITYGWWTDRLYTVNDPDHLVMCKGGHGARETAGENRARATSGMTSGAFLFGDNFSEKVVYSNGGGVVGYPEESRKRAIEFMGNADINDYVRNNIGSFMPVDGHHPSASQSAETLFVRRTANAVYLAAFNYGGVFANTGTVSFSRLGIDEDEEVTEIKELWTGEITTPKASEIFYNVPAKDARVYRLSLGNDTNGIAETTTDRQTDLNVISIGSHRYMIVATEALSGYNAFDVYGHLIASGTCVDRNADIDLSGYESSIVIVNVTFASGAHRTVKIVNR